MTHLQRFSGIIAKLRGGRGVYALVDQIQISGSNFLSTIVLVRGLGLPEFGKFSIAYILLLYANALQASFIAFPMLSLAPGMEAEEKREFVVGMYSIQLLASVALSFAFAAAGLIVRMFTSFYSLQCVVAFAFCVGIFQLQDWLRRYYFLHKKGMLAILNDFISYFVQLVLLFLLWKFDKLTLFRTFLVIGGTSAGAFSLGAITEGLHPAFRHLRKTWSRSRTLSLDLLIANQVSWFGTQGVLLIGTGIIGATAAGGLRATQSITGPVNLVLTSLENVVPIRVAEELKRNGAGAAHEYVTRTIVRCALLFAPLVASFAVFGRPILRILYGPSMEAFYVPMTVQLAAVMAQIAGRLMIYFCRGVQKSHAIIASNALGTGACLIAVYTLGRLWGATGVALAALVGQATIVGYCALDWKLNSRKLLEAFPGHNSSTTDVATNLKENLLADQVSI